ncbi:MAG: maltose/maltodextrin transport permease-like protein, partial [Candidatus Marinimicrobia bacterium]|nr:maltose/maltodextrin transport permease-like protein [Candidatus Neomarinimicrobiota bacterium]
MSTGKDIIKKTMLTSLYFSMIRILVFVTSVFIFSGCDQSDKTVIHIWHQMLYENRKALREVCDRYEEFHPEIKINLTYRETEELRSNFQSSAIGGSGPELIYGPSDQVGPFAVMGIIQSLDELFSSSYFDQFLPNAVVRFQDQIWMVGDGVGNHLMLMYNKELISAPPENTDELIQIGKSLTKDLNGDGIIDQYGLVWNFTEPFFFVPWIGGFGEWFINDDGSPNLNTESNENAFAFIKSLRDEHKIIPKECDYETANALFKTGRAAMIINGDWSWGDYRDKVDFGIAKLPMVSSTGDFPTPLVSTKGYSINVHTTGEKLNQTVELMTYLTSPEVQLHYVRRLNVQPSSLAALSHPDVQSNSLLKQNADIIKKGRPMPVVPELRAIWDALRGEYQSVLAGTKDPHTAAVESQRKAIDQIKIMNLVIEPGVQGKFIKGLLFLFIAALGIIFWIKKKIYLRSFQENKFAYLMLLPAFLGIMSIIIFPFGYNLIISLSNFSLRTFKHWEIIGFHHFASVLTDGGFYSLFGKTIIWTVVNVSFHVSLGVFLAVLINRTLPAKRILRTLLIIPWALPQYIAALTWRGM